jgi:FkbM family methyltransferase
MIGSARLASYFRELTFAWSATVDVDSFVRLATKTALFHARNALKRGVSYDTASFTVRLKFDAHHEYSLTLRPFAGDLFVLYEILLRKVYYLRDGFLPPDRVRVIVDCGGNIGITALYLAARYPNATIYSVEPHPDTYVMLLQNTAAEPRIVPVHAAVVGRPATTARITARNPAWGNKLTEAGPSLQAPAITLCQLIEQYNITQIDLLKVDIEGAEELVFAHGEFLAHVTLGIVELHAPYSRDHLDRDLSKWDFASQSPVPEQGLQMITFAKRTQAVRE